MVLPPSIGDIIRAHSADVDGAMEAAKQRARAEMGLDPEPDEGAGRPIPRTPVSPPKSRRRGGTISPRAAREGRRAVAETHTGTETETGTGTETGSDSAAADIRREVRAVTPGLRDRGEWSATFPRRTASRPTPGPGGPGQGGPGQGGPGQGRSFVEAQEMARTATASSGTESVRRGVHMNQALLDRLERQSSSTSLRQTSATPPLLRVSTVDDHDRSERSPSPSASPSGLDTESRQIAVYLSSPHLNTILHIPVPRSSPSFPSLRVSLAQVGSPTGHPVLVFLGLGCVRYLIALFDELASAFGLRLICIDRWGFGKTGMIDQSERDPMAWVDIVDQVLRELGVEGYHLLAHSAGTPYAMALAKRFPERVRGRIHLLAPWISADIDGGERERGAARARCGEKVMRRRNADSVQDTNGSNGYRTE
jgi:hypothetical protein